MSWRRPHVGLRPLRYMIAAAEQGSIRRAAGVLLVDQSAVSRRIAELERRLGVRLLDRSRKGVSLSAEGREFIDGIRPALAQLDESVELAFLRGRSGHNALRVGLHAPLGKGFLSELLGRFEAGNPNHRLLITDGQAEQHLARLRARQLDIGFISGVPTIVGMEVERLWQERLYLIFPTHHRLASCAEVSWTDLNGELLLVGGHDPTSEVCGCLANQIAVETSRIRVEYCSVQAPTLLAMIGLGKGIGLTTESMTSTMFPDLIYKPLAGYVDRLIFSAVWNPANETAILRRFLKLARTLRASDDIVMAPSDG